MTYATVLASITPYLQAIPSITTVIERNQTDRLVPAPDLMPAILLRDRPHAEKPLAVGYAESEWWLDCMVWATFTKGQDQASFNILREQVKQTLRNHQKMGASSADSTFGTQVIFSSTSMEVHDYPARMVRGVTYRHCLISALVCEGVSIAGVV